MEIKKVTPPKKSELAVIRILIICGLVAMGIFVWWFFGEPRMGYAPLYWPLTIALFFKLLRMLHEWYHYWSVSVPQKPPLKKEWKVDMLTTACPGEPHEMILKTLRAMKAVKYPHTTYLCDEGDDPVLKKACLEMDVVHVTRKEKTNAKAGNINNALKNASGEICVVLDPDHEPLPEFLDQVLPYFEDPKIGFVQVVQAYGNRKESLVALGACEQTYHFYGPMMMCMNSYGTAQAIGANCTFRRDALDSIGGHAAGLAEDMHTSMLLHSKGWKSVYVPEILSRGLVPASLSAYYKQQLKWSRGTFDLFFTTFLKNFRKFTFRQKIHYGTIPLYFFYGVIDFMNILVPVLSLLLAEFPWIVDLSEFARMIIPLIIITLLIRQYSQRWLLETNERGFHMIGGLLRIGTWWVFSLGFLYTLLKIKVPYIPTPKDDKPVNEWRISLPNIIVCGISLLAIIYGVYIDWNPFTFVMAGFAAVNCFILGSVVVMGQQHTLVSAYRSIAEKHRMSLIWPFRTIFWKVRHGFYNLMRNESLAFGLFTVFILLSYTVVDKHESGNKPVKITEKKTPQGFYAGFSLQEANMLISPDTMDSADKMPEGFNIVSFQQRWGPQNIEYFPDQLIQEIISLGALPMITWDPVSNTFPEFFHHEDLGENRMIFYHIKEGLFDDYLKAYARKVAAIGGPVFIRFAREPDNTAYPWSYKAGNKPKEYIEAWKYIVGLFNEQGAVNTVWVWNPGRAEYMYQFFPGADYIDWIGITCPGASDKKQASFDNLYEPYHRKLAERKLLKMPVMLTDFNVSCNTGENKDWLANTARSLKENFTEINSIVFSDMHGFSPELALINENTKKSSLNFRKLYATQQASEEAEHFMSADNYIEGSWGEYRWMVKGEQYYVKGVSYNCAHRLRDGHMPLTRKQLLKDFKAIKAMGANTISRFHPGIYDKNILNIAKKADLKVIYGFWFDADTDYSKDTAKMNSYIRSVEKAVLRYKNHDAVLAWSVGNQVWSGMKRYYDKPYLIYARKSYVAFIERLTLRIHELDPSRPVLTVLEQDSEFGGALADFRAGAPSLDIIGVNSYYDDYLGRLHEIFAQIDSTRPYLITEFGPEGYWRYDRESIKGLYRPNESPDYIKSDQYFWRWVKHVENKEGYNLGGLAYGWRDKPEGTATWFGLTDYKGRIKPSYYALQKLWGEKNAAPVLPEVYISAPSYALVPGKTYEFAAVAANRSDFEKNLNFEWFLRSEDDMRYIEELSSSDGGKRVKVKIPETASRIYLYVSDSKGNVVTASRPLKLYHKEKENAKVSLNYK